MTGTKKINLNDSELQGVIDMTKTFAVILAVSLIVLCAGGCQEEQASSNEKESRLLSAENKDLQTKLQMDEKKKDTEITNLRAYVKERDDEVKKLRTQLGEERTRNEKQINNFVTQCQADIKQRDETIETTKKECEKAAQEHEANLKIAWDVSLEVSQKDLELQAEVARLKKELAAAKGLPYDPNSDANEIPAI
jgi:hypothetical protein